MWDAIIAIILVSVGGGAGAVLRHFASNFGARVFGHVALGTFVVNVTGCFIIGLAGGLAVEADGSLSTAGAAWLLLVVGLLGSYTTVSSFSLQTLTLLREDRTNAAFANIAASLVICLCATITGFALTYSLGAVL